MANLAIKQPDLWQPPTKRLENWRYSPCHVLTDAPSWPMQCGSQPPCPLPDEFVQKHPMAALLDGQAVEVVEITSSTPITINRAEHGAHLIIHVADGVNAVINEVHDRPDRLNALTRISIGCNAHLTHFMRLDGDEEGADINLVHVIPQRDSCYNGRVLLKNGHFSRVEHQVDFNHPHAEAHISTICQGAAQSHMQNIAHMNHHKPHCTSSIKFRCVLDDKAHAVFRGVALVDEGAQKTDATQIARTLLLSDKAEIDARPELFIHADDVTCAHGATTGSLDEKALFLLRSRGIGQEQARNLLIRAFLTEGLEKIKDADIRTQFEHLLFGKDEA